MSAVTEFAAPAPELLLLQRWLRAQVGYAEAHGDEAFSLTTWWAKRLADLIDGAWADNAELTRELLAQASNAEKALHSVKAEEPREEPHNSASRRTCDV